MFEKINGLALKSYWLDSLGIFFAEYFPYILVICLFLFLVLNFRKYWPMVFLGLCSGALARGFAEAIRIFWGRPRPFIENHVNLLISHVNTASFPSGHASFFFGISVVVLFFNKKAGIIFLIASLLISMGRVFGGIHWPYDIVGGFLVGTFSALVLMKIVALLKK